MEARTAQLYSGPLQAESGRESGLNIRGYSNDIDYSEADIDGFLGRAETIDASLKRLRFSDSSPDGTLYIHGVPSEIDRRMLSRNIYEKGVKIAKRNGVSDEVLVVRSLRDGFEDSIRESMSNSFTEDSFSHFYKQSYQRTADRLAKGASQHMAGNSPVKKIYVDYIRPLILGNL